MGLEDINGTPIAPDAIRLDKMRAGGQPGAPNPQYGHRVSMRLAGTGAVAGKNVLGFRLIKGNPEIPFVRASRYGPQWGGFSVTEVEAFFEPRRHFLAK